MDTNSRKWSTVEWGELGHWGELGQKISEPSPLLVKGHWYELGQKFSAS